GLGRKRKPSAVGVLLRDANGLPEDRRGIAISTYGKVIKRGWNWLGITPATPESVAGAFEAPELASCFTLNKSDFLRSGNRGATYLESPHLPAKFSNRERRKISLPRPMSLCHLQVVSVGPPGTDLPSSSSREARTRNWRAWSSPQSGNENSAVSPYLTSQRGRCAMMIR